MGKIIIFKEAVFDTVVTDTEEFEALIWIANKKYKVCDEHKYFYILENDFDDTKRGISKDFENELYDVMEVDK